jgi:competence protein ComEA
MFRALLSTFVVSCLLSAVPSPLAFAQTKAAPRAAAKTAPASTAIVNLNTASASDLEGLPGIGAKTAARIVEYRQKNGPFKKIEELMNVRGVGEKNFLKLKPQISVSPAKADHDQADRR